MLDRAKFMGKLQKASGELFVDLSDEYSLARVVWSYIADDVTFVHRVRGSNSSLLLPTWSGHLCTTVRYENTQSDYKIVAVDGSQIYVDKHQGTSCFLINIGYVAISYNSTSPSSLSMVSEPYLFLPDVGEFESSSRDLINCRRHEYELREGQRQGATFFADRDQHHLLLFDGSLIFWHLDAKEEKFRAIFLPKYLSELEQLYQLNILHAGYISLPKSGELVNLMRVALSDGCYGEEERMEWYKKIGKGDEILLNHMVDTNVASFFLRQGERTICFKSNASVTQDYADHLKPYFFYFHLSYEIVRIEIPAWIAKDEEKIDLLCSIILDQSIKGQGYPVVLAEAHEQAVIKSVDRDFFYQSIMTMSAKNNTYLRGSKKAFKKKTIGI